MCLENQIQNDELAKCKSSDIQNTIYMYIYIYTYTHICMYICVYIHIAINWYPWGF